MSKALAEAHYADLSSKPFFGGLIEYITSGPVVAIALEGKNVVEQARKIIGATNPLAADPGSIRGQFAIDIGRNIIHGSDTVENAQKELALWFPDGLVDNTPVLYGQVRRGQTLARRLAVWLFVVGVGVGWRGVGGGGLGGT